MFNRNFKIYFIRVYGIWLCLCIQEGIQDGYQLIYTQLYFSILSALLSKYVFFWMLKLHTDTPVYEMHTYIFYVHNMSINKIKFWEQVYIIWFLCWNYMYI